MNNIMNAERFFKDSDEDRLEFYEQFYNEGGYSWAEIAKLLDTYPNKVRRDAKKLGFKSRSKSEAQKLALDEGRHSHPTKGKNQSEETKIKISESQGKVWDSLSEEEREYRSQIGSEAWNKKTEEEKREFFKKSVEAIHKSSVEGSEMEKYLFDHLIQKGYRVKKHSEHLVQNERFHIDLYIPECRMAIEVDGPMHQDPIFGEEKLQKRQAADAQKNGLILSSGMVLVRVQLDKRRSLRYKREIADKLMEIVNKVEKKFPPKHERFFRCQ